MPSETVFRGSSTVPCMVGRAVLGVAALLVASLLAGCSGSDDPTPRPTGAPTPISKLDPAAVRVLRAEFCDRVPASAVKAALGGKAEGDEKWGNGDPVPGAGSGEVGHEVGCAWTAAGGAVARAWVFVRPVTAELAGSLVQQAGKQPGCTAEPTGEFGAPAVLQTCALADGAQRIRRAGLFADSWLTCELGGQTAPDQRARLDRWCAAVVAADAVPAGG